MTTIAQKQITLDDVRLQIIKIRTGLGMSQSDFAELVDADQSQLSGWENGVSAPSLASLKKVATIDSVSLAGFFEQIETGQRSDIAPISEDITTHFKPTIRELAREMGVGVPTYAKHAAEPQRINIGTALSAAKHLRIPLSQLLHRAEQAATAQAANVLAAIPALTFTVPGPPVPKERARRAPNGRWYTPTKTRDYERLVASCALHAGAKPKTGPVHITLAIFWPDRRSRDADNVLKSVQDGLNGIAYDDDRQVIGFTVTTDLDRSKPRAVVSVRYMQ